MDILTPVLAELRSMTQGDVKALALKLGEPFGTLMHIRRGKTKSPGVLVVQRLYEELVYDDRAKPRVRR